MLNAMYIANKRAIKKEQKAKTIYCGRGSALGNPFAMKGENERDKVCDLYQLWFKKQVSVQTPSVVRQLIEIVEAATKGIVYLECYCAPKRCHCETIRDYIENLTGN